MKVLRTFVVSICILTFLFAGQTGKIAGRVTDLQTGDPLIGCNVIVEGTPYGASTDVNGEYFVINLTPGTYDLRFSMIGYAEFRAVGVVVNIDVTTPFNAALTSQALEMEMVTVTAERPIIDNTLTSSKQIISGSLTTDLNVIFARDVVKTLPGVTEFKGELHLRGGRAGEEIFLVDGASVVSPIMGGEAVHILPQMIEELQVIMGTFNAEYGQAMSGVFNTVLKEARPGVHANINFRTSLSQPYFKGEGAKQGQFEDWEVYKEQLKVAIEDGYRNATSSEFSKGDFGGNKTITDVTLSVGTGTLGLITSVRLYDDPGRLPGISEKHESFQSKLTYQLGGNLKLGAEVLYHTENAFYDPTYDAMKVAGSGGQLDMWDWKFALEQYPRTEEQVIQFGLTANYVLSPNTNITVRVDNLNKTQEDGAKTKDGKFVNFEDVTTVTYAGDKYSGADGPDHTKVMEDVENKNAWFGMMNVYGHYFKAEQSHTTFGMYGTSQVNARHLLKGGVEYRMFDITRIGHDVWFGRTVGYSDDTPRLQTQNIQDVSPFEMLAYVQDQIEFNDIIVNVGFRFDAFNAGADKGVWDVSSDGKRIWEDKTINPFDPAKRRATETKSKISPRLGISFPIGDNMAFRYAYGTFFQRPTFYDLLENYLVQMDGGTESGYFVYIGNPNLDPMETTIYEMGLQYGLPGGYKVDVSGYYKDIANLLAAQELFNAAFVDSGQAGDNPGNWAPGDVFQATHIIYKNSDHFGNVRGLELSLSKMGSSGLTGRASYTFSIARGTASDKMNQGSGTLTQETQTWTANILTMTTLDWHRPHIFNGYLDYHTSLGGMLNRVGGNVTFNAQSGLPMTARAGGAGAALKERAPMTVDINLRVDATLNLGVVRPTVYLLVDNIMNRRNVVAIADPASYFDAASDFDNVAGGPRNNLLAYGPPMTLHIGVSIDY